MATRSIDPLAVQRQLRRLLRARQASDGGPWLHAEVARRMGDRLPLIRLQPQQIVEWWGLLGNSDAVLRQAYPDARRTIVEPDADWAEAARREQRAPWWSARRWQAAAAQVVVDGEPLGSAQYQLAWANMVLHAVADPPALLRRWHELLQPDGFLMFSSLGPDTGKQLRAVYAEAGCGPPGIEFVDMHDLGDMLLEAGFADPVMDQETLTLTWADGAALLAELRSLGGNVAPGRDPGLRTPRWREQLEARLRRCLAGPDGRLQMSFEVAYGHAFKGLPRTPPLQQASVSLDEMRKLLRERSAPGGDRGRLG